LRGPFAEWFHLHGFVEVDDHTTDVLDEITLRLRLQLFWWFIGLRMRLDLPLIFASRAWKTKHMLE
jgi:ligand-binding SRPBCC domain-containing protein